MNTPATQSPKSARQRLRRLVKRGDLPASPLFVPLAHAVAAAIEGWDVQTLIGDPTRLSRGLTALHHTLQTDGVVCFSDAGVVVEALGATLDWQSYPPRVAEGPAAECLDGDGQAVLRVMAAPRVRSGIEVVGRLNTTLDGEPLLAVLLTGPATLAAEIAALTGGPGPDAGLRRIAAAGRVATELCRAFGEAGAHLFVIREEVLPQDPRARDAWQAALTSLTRIVRFYQAQPVVLPMVDGAVADVDEAPVDAHALCGGTGVGRAVARALTRAIETWAIPAAPCGLLITAGEMPADCPISDLRQACAGIRASLAEHVGAAPRMRAG